jgi:hypothetical protein
MRCSKPGYLTDRKSQVSLKDRSSSQIADHTKKIPIKNGYNLGNRIISRDQNWHDSIPRQATHLLVLLQNEQNTSIPKWQSMVCLRQIKHIHHSLQSQVLHISTCCSNLVYNYYLPDNKKVDWTKTKRWGNLLLTRAGGGGRGAGAGGRGPGGDYRAE